MPGRQSLAIVATCLLAGGLVGCGRTVAVDPPPPDPSCEERVARLPDELAGQGRRDTDAVSTAAWGSPPIIVRCGVAEPVALGPTSALVEVDGIAWFPEPLERGTMFTTVGTQPRWEVAVPTEQEPASAVLVGLADVVGADAP